jgi:hypothetical protein
MIMRKSTTLFFALLLAGIQLFGQSNPKVLSSTDIVWAGIDFSKTRMIGSEGFTDPDAIVNDYFDKWNQLVIMESDKYDFAKAYQKVKVKNDFAKASEQNGTVDPDELVINTTYSFSDGDVQSIVSNYKGLEGESGVGLLYIVEYFNKLDNVGSVYVVFFDLDSQEILHSKNYQTKPKGFGLRNYWASTIYETIKESGKDYKKAVK